MRVYKRKGSPNWWITWNDQNGKRHRKSSGTVNKKEADALAAKWIKEDFMEEHFGKKPDVSFSEALLRYAKAAKQENLKSFQRSSRYRLNHLKDRFGSFMLSEITLTIVQDYMDERMREATRSTVQRDASTLRAIMNKAYREGLMDKPPKFPRFKSLHSRKRWLTLKEEQKLISHASPHLIPIICFAVDTGGRLSEILNLDWREVDLSNKRVRFIKTKNGEDRSIPLCDRAIAVLSSLKPKEIGPVFTFRGQKIANVDTSFRKARSKAGLEDVRFHDLRHTFASRLVQGGVPLYDVQHLMGHKSLDMVQRYAHLAPDFGEKAIQTLNRVGHKLGTVASREAA